MRNVLNQSAASVIEMPLAAILLVALLGMPAARSVRAATVHTDDFIADASRTGFVGFESLPNALVGSRSHVEGALRIDQIQFQSSGARSDMLPAAFSPEGERGWLPNGGDFGYTRISRLDGGDFSSVGLLRGSLYSSDQKLLYALYDNGVQVQTGTVAPHDFLSNARYLGFSGGGFDEVRLRDGQGTFAFNDNIKNGLAIDAVETAGLSAPPTAVFSQTPQIIQAVASDRHFNSFGSQTADDFMLASPATLNNVTWRGAFSNDAPAFPVSFELFVYAKQPTVFLPDRSNVLSQTVITFDSADDFIDTGLDTPSGRNIYEFRADLTPVDLVAGTQYWFSPLANTTGDGGTNLGWFWASGSHGLPTASGRTEPNSLGTNFAGGTTGDMYFALNVVPEPVGLGSALMATGALLRGRRPRRKVIR